MPKQPESAAVLFNRQTKDLDVIPDVYLVENGNTLELTLDLVTVGPGGGDASFLSPAGKSVSFKSGDPPGLTVTGGTNQILLSEKNNNPNVEPEAFPFRVLVRFQDQIYITPDPTIVNQGTPGEQGQKPPLPPDRPDRRMS